MGEFLHDARRARQSQTRAPGTGYRMSGTKCHFQKKIQAQIVVPRNLYVIRLGHQLPCPKYASGTTCGAQTAVPGNLLYIRPGHDVRCPVSYPMTRAQTAVPGNYPAKKGRLLWIKKVIDNSAGQISIEIDYILKVEVPTNIFVYNRTFIEFIRRLKS